MVAIRRKMTLAKSELVLIVSKYCLGNRSAKLTGRCRLFFLAPVGSCPASELLHLPRQGLDLPGWSPPKLSIFNGSPDLVSFNAGLQAVGRK
jgi:hypothetical protein